MDDDENVRRRRNSPDHDAQSDEEKIRIKEDYFKSLQLWIQHAQFQQNLTTYFPYYMMAMQNNAGPYINNNYQVPGMMGNLYRAFPNHALPNRNMGNGVNTAQNFQNMPQGNVYTIPPIWKRFFAEFIDFIILFFVKLGVTLIAVDFFEYIDLDKFDIDTIKKNLQEDYRMAVQMTTEILVLECVYRILVCIFEAICLSAYVNGRIIGATPGKVLLGIRVVNASSIVRLANDDRETVLVTPGTDLTFWTAFARSVIKNILIALLFPLCLVLFFFQYNRTGYDIFCNVVVVDDIPQRHDQQRQ